MPDARKIAKLERAGVAAVSTCGSCANWVPGAQGERRVGVPPWGSCRVIQSEHQKHTDGGRASVRADMTCGHHVHTLEADADLRTSGLQHLQQQAPAVLIQAALHDLLDFVDDLPYRVSGGAVDDARATLKKVRP